MEIGSLAWFVGVVVGTLILGGGIAFAMLTWRHRRRDPEIRCKRRDAVEKIYEDARRDEL
jgi:hypothetical protein